MIVRSESELQEAVFKLSEVLKKFNMNIFPSKTKVMAFRGTTQIRADIEIQNIVIEQANSVT